MIDINELRQRAQAATPGPWVAKNVSGSGLEIHMAHPVYPDKEWPAFGTDSAFCKKGLVSYETWTQFPYEVQNVQQSKNAEFIAAANPATVIELLDRLESTEKDIALKERIIDSLGSELNAAAGERDDLLARIEEMEKQEPVASFYIEGTGQREFDDWKCNLPIGRSLLYLAPGAKGE